MDLAASIQAVTEEVMLRIGRHVHAADRHEEPGAGRRRGAQLRGQRPAAARRAVRRHLDPAGRGRRRRRARRRAVRLASTARQAARSRTRATPEGQLARARVSPTTRSRRFLDASGRRYRRLRRRGRAAATTSPSCWPTGRSSAGSRGAWSSVRARSARAASSATRASPEMQATMNLKIKFRESFRPFAPCVLREHAHEWFDMRPAQESPYMLLVAPVREQHRVALTETSERRWRTIPTCASASTSPRSTIPAVTHVDYSARGADRRRRAATRASTGCCKRSTRRPAARCSSTPASTSAASRSSARRRTPIAASWPPRWTSWSSARLRAAQDASGAALQRGVDARAVPGAVRARLKTNERGPDDRTSIRTRRAKLRQFAAIVDRRVFGALTALRPSARLGAFFDR